MGTNFLIFLLYISSVLSQYLNEELVVADFVKCEGKDVFHCDDKQAECISKDKICNGVNECSTGRDESVEECGCLKDIEFQCNASVCIDMIRRCDTKQDCVDGKDEEGCVVYECPPTHSKCKNHFCVPRDAACNFENDCGDWSDEQHCEYSDCYHQSQFRCNNSQCIFYGYLCDGEINCEDASDETNCGSYFRCGDGTYKNMDLVCDGWVDCNDQSDETNCGPCKADDYHCGNGRCIRLSNVCDGKCDCGYSCDDENTCDNYSCTVGENYPCRFHHTSTVRCIDKKYLCDDRNDCWNAESGSDESLCLKPNQTCADLPYLAERHIEKYFICPEGRCLPASGPENATCNYFYDCLNGEDEEGCMFPDCAVDEYRCTNHQCIPASRQCDGNFDCFDRTDEANCGLTACQTGEIKCRSGQCIPEVWWCDYVRDCPDGSDETQCPERRSCGPNEFTCKNGQCIDMNHVCYYDPDNLTRKGCADKSHLLNCSSWQCRDGQFKCNKSFCIDGHRLCDGVPDCTETYVDETNCPYSCPYQVDVCVCKEDEMNCTNLGLEDLPEYLTLERNLIKFVLAGNRIGMTFNADTFFDLDRLSYLDMSNNLITELPDGVFQNLFRLVTLNLKDNQIRRLGNGSFSGLTSIRALYLSGNGIEEIYPSAFVGLSQLQTLDLSHQRLVTLQSGTFLGLRSLFSLDLSYNTIQIIQGGGLNGLLKLLTLDISNNEIMMIESNAFHGLPNLRTLHTDEFPYCCMVKTVENCYPKPDEFSSCEDLMSNFVLRTSIWILGSLACFGNLLVIGWRIKDFKNGKVHSFLIANLAIGDFFMGVYLMIIAVVDTYYRGNYYIYDRYWRESVMCKFAGFISTLSSELSVLTLTVITLDRLVCIIFPLKLKRLGMKEALIVMPSLWVLVVFLSACPLMGIEYFENFYGRSGVCLAFHITPDHVGGWEYSVFVFLVLNFVSFLLIFLSYLWMFFVAKKTTTAVRKSKALSDKSMAKRMTLIVMTDFMCWVPIILLGFASLGGAHVPQQVYAWIAVFVLPLNSAINPVLYTISTATFLGNVRKRACRFRKSFTGGGSYRSTDTKHSIVDDKYMWHRNSGYRQLELTRLRGLNKSYSLTVHNNHSTISRM
ncbi:G-protein coupled receptor GRL101-like isoform X1 [Mytilus trossulus]|uniref:G-protein coupled receptor GRL101-like isoform X1 n=1 Tax=Mytilus trossulus TaxID=6551 RepID=UPI003006E1C3